MWGGGCGMEGVGCMDRCLGECVWGEVREEALALGLCVFCGWGLG